MNIKALIGAILVILYVLSFWVLIFTGNYGIAVILLITPLILFVGLGTYDFIDKHL